MKSPDRSPAIESSWNDEMPWSFYAQQAALAAQEAGEDTTGVIAMEVELNDGRENHIQERQREWR